MKKSMNIAFVVDGFPVISETFILNQITGLIDLGHNVKIFARYKTKEVFHPDILKYNLIEKTYYADEIVPLNWFKKIRKAVWLTLINFHKNPLVLIKTLNLFKYRRNAINLRYLLYAIHFLDVDIIHCHYGTNGRDYLFLKDILGAKARYITTFHAYELTKDVYAGNGFYNHLFQKGDLFLPISSAWQKKLVQGGCPKERIVVHHMGVDNEKFAFRERLFKDGNVKILSVARLVEKKGLEYSIRAVAKLVPQYPEIRYLIVGDGPLHLRLNGLIHELAMENYISLLGPLPSDKVNELMYQAHILIQPSVTASDGNQEGIPVSLMEAMATGMPVISTWHSGIPELIEDGKSGFLVSERDVNGLANKCEYLISHPDRCLEMGRIGRRFIEENFDILKLNRKLVELYGGAG